MLDSIGYGLLNLGVLLSIIAYIVHLREKKKTEYNFSRVYIVSTITSLSLWSSLALLTALFATSDYSVIAVFQNSDNSMSLTQRIMATWASRQGVMILWASIMSTISIFAIRTVKDELNNFVEYRFTSITLFFNALIALFTMSVRDPRPFESFSSMIPTDGQGLTPSLLSFWQQIHPPIAFLAYSSFIVPYAFGIASLSYQRAQHKPSVVLTKLNDFFILLGWGTTTLFIIAGSIWGYEENWAGFWNWDPVEVAALVMWTSATLYFHVKSQVSDNHALRYSTAALGWISVAFASFIVRSGLLRGLHSYLGVNIPQTIVFGTLLVGSLLTLLWALRQSGMELFPEYLYNLKSHSNKPRFLTFWVLTAMLLANVVGLLVQIYNSIAFDFHEYPYEFYVYINGILLFLLGVLLVYCEIDFERFSRDTIHRVWLGLSIVFGILLYFLLIDTILTTIFVAILTSAFLILLWDFGIDARSRNFRKARLKITHILVVLMIISYISVDYNTEYTQITANENEEKYVEKFNLYVTIQRSIDPVSGFLSLIVDVKEGDRDLGKAILTHGEYPIQSGSFWTRGDWIVTPFYDLFLNSLESRVDLINSNAPISIAIKKVPLANYFRVLFILFTITVPMGLVSMARKFKVQS